MAAVAVGQTNNAEQAAGENPSPLSGLVLELPHGPGNPRNSEGSFAALKDGRILFAYTRYVAGSGADHDPADIVGRLSADGGRTWPDEDRILVSNEGGCNVMSVSLLRLRDGRLAMFYLHKAVEGTDCRPYVRFSGDEGKTWSERTCCATFPGYFCQLNDQAVQLASGRIVIPVSCHTRIAANGAVEAGDSRIGVFFSDDGGRSWHASKEWWAPGHANHGAAEPVVVELKDRTLYCVARTKLNCQWESVSQDGGDTWAPPRPSPFRGPAAPMTIKRMPGTGHLLAVWNDLTPRWGVPQKKLVDGWANDESWGRTPLVAAVSTDEGKSWLNARALETAPDRGFCYTATHFTEDAVLLAYCCGGSGKSMVLADLRIRRVGNEWFDGQENRQ